MARATAPMFSGLRGGDEDNVDLVGLEREGEAISNCYSPGTAHQPLQFRHRRGVIPVPPRAALLRSFEMGQRRCPLVLEQSNLTYVVICMADMELLPVFAGSAVAIA